MARIRIEPRPGQRLSIDDVTGLWRPSGAVVGAGVFALVWSTPIADYWAALHDFEPVDLLKLVDKCRVVDQAANGPCPFPRVRQGI